MRHFRRAACWRQALLAACLPYLLVTVFVDFVHVHGGVNTAVPAASGVASINAPGQPAPQRDYTCTACIWLRTGLQLTSNTPAGVVAQAKTSDFVLPADALWPDSSIPHPALLRGPPSSLLG